MDSTAEETQAPSEETQAPATPAGRSAKPRAAAAAAKPRAAAARTESEAEKTYDITLHASDEIPPNGQFIGVNGAQYYLKPGIRTRVPAGVLGVLDNAVQSVPERDDTGRVIGWKDAPRLTYTLHRD